MIRTLIIATLATLACMPVAAPQALANGTGGTTYAPKAPSYADRNADAPFRAYVQPRSSVTIERQCPSGGYFTEYSAYMHNGSAMGAQRTERYPDGYVKRAVWRDRSGRSVTFDGLTFRNHTRRAVWVAGWCS